MSQSDFFVAGGTLRAHTPSYVTRPADRELFEHVLAGEFCYVLTSRQMGKSSLMVWTAQRLKDRGCTTVIIDLTSIGTVSIDEWYLGLLTRIKNGLRLPVDVQAWWSEHHNLGAPQRFREFLHDIALAEITSPIAIFIDEIDTTINFVFRDDFFAAIRAMYNARASDPTYNRLTFVLFGVATPTDLIRDRERTPFNIGRRIDLQEFSYTDAQVLKEGLEACHSGQGDRILARIFYWTDGHPYLTQKLCLAATSSLVQIWDWDDEKVDELVEHNFFSDEARKDTNLTFVQDRILASPVSERRRMLNLYSQVYGEKTIPDDDRSPIQNYLELFGLIRVEKGKLRVRNEIYRRVFNQDWIKANTPANTSQIIAIAASLVAVLLIALTTYIILGGQISPDAQAKIYRESFHSDSSPDVRIEALANLFNLGVGYDQQALELFYSLSPYEQQNLFLDADSRNLGQKIVTVVRKISVTLDRMPDEGDRAIMEAMISALNRSQQSGVDRLIEEISNWKQGRELEDKGQYQQAVDAYTAAIKSYGNNDNDINPVVRYDRAMAYIVLEKYRESLLDLDQIVGIAMKAPPTPTSISALPLISTIIVSPSVSDLTHTPTDISASSTPRSISTNVSATVTSTSTLTVTSVVTPIETLRFINTTQIIKTVDKTVRENQYQPELTVDYSHTTHVD